MKRFLTDEQGAAAVEYSLFLSLVGVVIAGTVQLVGGDVAEALSFINAELGSTNIDSGSK